MVVPIMGEWAFIVEPITVVRVTGMAPGVATERGTMARVAPQVGAGALLHGIMDQEVPAVSGEVRPRGAAAPGTQPDGEAARSTGVAAPALFMELTVARGDGEGNARILERLNVLQTSQVLLHRICVNLAMVLPWGTHFIVSRS
jgi:hypothetical protein